MTDIPEEIKQEAERIAGEYLRFNISCQRLFDDVAKALMARDKRAAKIARGFRGRHKDKGGILPVYGDIIAGSIADAIETYGKPMTADLSSLTVTVDNHGPGFQMKRVTTNLHNVVVDEKGNIRKMTPEEIAAFKKQEEGR